MKGKLIVFEGGEGAGKTTQLDLSYNWLIDSGLFAQMIDRNIFTSIVKTQEPGGTNLGKSIRYLLLHALDPIQERAELLLYAADRTQHVETVLRPKLEAGALVLCDRFTASTVAYQGYGRGLDLELINRLNTIATDGIEPDLTIWLDVDPAVGLERAQAETGNRDRIEQEAIGFHQRVREGYRNQAQFNKMFYRVDTDSVKAEVWREIQGLLSFVLDRWLLKEKDSSLGKLDDIFRINRP